MLDLTLVVCTWKGTSVGERDSGQFVPIALQLQTSIKYLLLSGEGLWLNWGSNVFLGEGCAVEGAKGSVLQLVLRSQYSGFSPK